MDEQSALTELSPPSFLRLLALQPKAPHGGFKVVGDAPLKVLTVHIVDKGKPLVELVN